LQFASVGISFERPNATTTQHFAFFIFHDIECAIHFQEMFVHGVYLGISPGITLAYGSKDSRVD
jgi:hypothetical protein